MQSDVTGRDLYGALERLVRFVRQLDSDGDLSSAAIATLGRLVRDGAHAIGMLARAERVSQPNMTQLVDRLEQAGLVARTADERDRRVTLVAITDAGRDALERRRAARADALQPHLDRLDASDRAALAAALPAIDRLVTANQ